MCPRTVKPMKPLLLSSTMLTVLVGVGGASLIASSSGQPDAAQTASAAPVPPPTTEPAATLSTSVRLASAPGFDAGRAPVPIQRAPNPPAAAPDPPAAAKVTPPMPQEERHPAGGSAIAGRDAPASVDERTRLEADSRARLEADKSATVAPDPPISPPREWMTGPPATFAQPGQPYYVIVLRGAPPPMIASWERPAWEWRGGKGKHRPKKWRDRDD